VEVQNGWYEIPSRRLGAVKHTAGLTVLFKGTLAGRPCSVLIDTGASFSFLDEGWLQQNAERLEIRKGLLFMH